MAFNLSGFSKWSIYNNPGPQLFGYLTSTDTISNVSSSSYFSPLTDLISQAVVPYTINIGDTIQCICSDGDMSLFVTDINPISTVSSVQSNQISRLINQNGHGFVVGNIVSYSSTSSSYVLCNISYPPNYLSPLMVSNVIDANNFYVTQEGYVTGLKVRGTPLTPGIQYYISFPYPGTLSDISPGYSYGSAIIPCFVSDSSTSGYFSSTQETVPIGNGYNGVSSWLFANDGDVSTNPNTGYINGPASSTREFELPIVSNSTRGEVITVTQYVPYASAPSYGFKITQSSNVSIQYGSTQTTQGSSGYLSLGQTSGVYSGSTTLLCVYNNGTSAIWNVINGIGSFSPN